MFWSNFLFSDVASSESLCCIFRPCINNSDWNRTLYILHSNTRELQESVIDYVKLWFSMISRSIMIHLVLFSFVHPGTFHLLIKFDFSVEFKLSAFVVCYTGGFLTFRPSIPKSLLLDGEHNLDTHFTLVNYQVCYFFLLPFLFPML